MREFKKFFAGGSWVEPASTESIAVTNPTTEAVVASVPLGAAGRRRALRGGCEGGVSVVEHCPG